MENEWWPSLEEYNPNISKEKWLEILDNRNLTTEQNLHVFACIFNFGGEATCTQLAQKYGDTKNTYNSGSSNYAKNLVKANICEDPPFREDGNSRWWPVLYVGHNAEKETSGSYVWKLRDELKEACKEYGIEKWLNIAKEDKSISKRIWKLSHGKDFSEDDVQYYLSESIACVHKDTSAKGVSYLPQGKAFTDEAKSGDLFYLCRGNQEILLIGEFISNEVDIDNDGWAYRKYKKLYSSIKKGSYEGPNKWWTPNNNSTFIEIKKTEYSEFEEYILIPFFGINLQTLNLLSGENEMDKINECKKLLKNTHNLILHGAPGTGKTHLAKDIAAQIMLNKNYNDLSDEEKESIKDQIGFVQFHPSYDYTDFVEGLRPVKDENGNVAFERMDGVFKKICSQVVKDKIKLQKTPQELIKEENTQEIVSKFLVESITDQRKFETVKNVSFYIKTYNKTHVIVMFETKDGTLKDAERIKYTDFINLYNSNKKIERSNIKDILGRKVERQADTYLCPIVNEMKKDQILPQLYTWKDTQTKFILKRGSDYEYEYFISEINEKYITIESSSTNGIKISSPTHRIDILDLLTTEETDSEDQYVRYYIEDLKNQLNKKEYFDSEEEKILGEKKFVFIIDEINRGELSKIFGELFYCIDPGYRGENGKISTQYQNLIEEDDPFYEGFYIPENVYIIGTMNDIDRSVESMDFAFRRRFTFKEITAKDTQETILSELDDSIREEAVIRMDSLNNAIDGIDGLSSAYHIGGAYFLKLKDLENSFENLWEYHLSGLLREYLRGMEDAEDSLEKLHKAYNLENQE